MQMLHDFLGIPHDKLLTEENAPNNFVYSAYLYSYMNSYFRLSPDIVFKKMADCESSHEVMEEDIVFLFKMFMLMDRLSLTNTTNTNKERFSKLIEKYKIDLRMEEKESVNPILLRWAFPIIFYNVSKDNSDFKYNCSDKMMNEYKNFTIPLQNVGILGVLPKNKKYGGFVKALYNVSFEQFGKGDSKEETCMSNFRAIYSSKVVPQSIREELFAQFNVNEDDCAEWSKVFDAKFPDYKDMHKYFEQIA